MKTLGRIASSLLRSPQPSINAWQRATENRHQLEAIGSALAVFGAAGISADEAEWALRQVRIASPKQKPRRSEAGKENP